MEIFEIITAKCLFVYDSKSTPMSCDTEFSINRYRLPPIMPTLNRRGREPALLQVFLRGSATCCKGIRPCVLRLLIAHLGIRTDPLDWTWEDRLDVLYSVGAFDEVLEGRAPNDPLRQMLVCIMRT